MIQVTVFVPLSHKEFVKAAMFAAGGGKIGNYDFCCFEQVGIGQFRPLVGSQAFVGTINQVEMVEEVRIEMVCDESHYKQVIDAMKASHPYETPAYYGIKTVE
jgi:hypothetical protein